MNINEMDTEKVQDLSRPGAAEQILLQWLVAWKIKDPEQRLNACSRCKLATIQWQQQYSGGDEIKSIR